MPHPDLGSCRCGSVNGLCYRSIETIREWCHYCVLCTEWLTPPLEKSAKVIFQRNIKVLRDPRIIQLVASLSGWGKPDQTMFRKIKSHKIFANTKGWQSKLSFLMWIVDSATSQQYLRFERRAFLLACHSSSNLLERESSKIKIITNIDFYSRNVMIFNI